MNREDLDKADVLSQKIKKLENDIAVLDKVINNSILEINFNSTPDDFTGDHIRIDLTSAESQPFVDATKEVKEAELEELNTELSNL